jgi:hypothetical protein
MMRAMEAEFVFFEVLLPHRCNEVGEYALSCTALLASATLSPHLILTPSHDKKTNVG